MMSRALQRCETSSSSTSTSLSSFTCLVSFSSASMVDNTLDTQNRPSEATAATLVALVSSTYAVHLPSLDKRQNSGSSPLIRVVCPVRSAKHARRRSRQFFRNSSENAGVGALRS